MTLKQRKAILARVRAGCGQGEWMAEWDALSPEGRKRRECEAADRLRRTAAGFLRDLHVLDRGPASPDDVERLRRLRRAPMVTHSADPHVADRWLKVAPRMLQGARSRDRRQAPTRRRGSRRGTATRSSGRSDDSGDSSGEPEPAPRLCVKPGCGRPIPERDRGLTCPTCRKQQQRAGERESREHERVRNVAADLFDPDGNVRGFDGWRLLMESNEPVAGRRHHGGGRVTGVFA